MKRFFHSVQARTIAILILFMTLSLFGTWFSIRYLSEKITTSQKEETLLLIANMMDLNLGEKSYRDILLEEGAENAPRDEQIAVLNRVLADRCDAVAAIRPGLGIGYYSLELDAILTYAPSSEYQNSVGVSIAPDHPGRIVMATNEQMIRMGTMVRGNIMNAMHPIERHGEVIGYVWANELTASITDAYVSFMSGIMIIMGIFYVFSITLAVDLSRRSMRDIHNIVHGVSMLRTDLRYTLPKASGDLGDLVDSINAMSRDIAKMEEERKARFLAEASNLAQKDFIARMSHELRTPMNGVLGMTRLAQGAPTEEKRLEYLDKIHSSASILLGIINDILDFSKIEAGKMEIDSYPFSIAETVENIQDLISPRILEKGLVLSLAVDDSVPPMVVGDGLRLSQVLLNLLGNAVKFTPKGTISLEISATPLPEDKLALHCKVKDTGIGMDATRQQEVFRPFTQADKSTTRKFGGTGLGLSISRALVSLMGGEITVTSAPGEGSEFSFSANLLQYNGEAPNTAAETDMSLLQRYDGLRLLVVEDNEINQEIANAIFTEMGFSVSLADNGEKGVAAFRNEKFDCIFMDIRMPVMDGLQASKEIRKLEKARKVVGEGVHHIPIIAMTANAMQEDREACRAAGMDGHVAKPIDLTEIRHTLFKILMS